MNRREAAQVYAQLAEQTDAVAGRFDALAQEAAEGAKALRAELEGVARELAAVYLPELTAEALALAGQWTGYRGFTRRDPLKALAHEEPRLRHDLAQLLQDERWERREALAGPNGSLTRSLVEAREFLAPWQVECDKFELLEGFLELLEIGYDTPAFAERWWQPVYWRHWAAGDRVCDQLGVADFGDDVLPAYAKARAPRDQWRAEVARIEAEIGAVHSTVQRHDQLEYRLAHLPELYLQECREQVGVHLQNADPAMLEVWSQGEPPLPEAQRRGALVLLRRISGLNAKIDTFSQVGAQWSQAQGQALVGQAEQFRAKAAKLLSNPRKHSMQANDPPLDHSNKLARLEGRADKARGTLHRVRRFDRYEEFSLANDPALWWMLFSDHRAPPIFVPQYRDWYARNPTVAVVVESPGEAPVLGGREQSALGDFS